MRKALISPMVSLNATEASNFLKNIEEKIPADTVTLGLTDLPDVAYEIDHVYGFNCDRNQCVLFGKDSNEIVFATAALGVVQDIPSRK